MSEMGSIFRSNGTRTDVRFSPMIGRRRPDRHPGSGRNADHVGHRDTRRHHMIKWTKTGRSRPVRGCIRSMTDEAKPLPFALARNRNLLFYKLSFILVPTN